MFRSLFIFIVFLLPAGLYAQDVLPLNNVKAVEALKESYKGKVLLVNFWATWCTPCVKEFPDLVKLYKNYKKKDFKVIFISVDLAEDIEGKVKPFLKKKDVNFTSYYNNFENVEELINYFDKNWEGNIPATYIFNKDGELSGSLIGNRDYKEFEKEIKKVLD